VAERLSHTDGSLIAGYGEHIQRYRFALEYCRGKRVVDAGCGVGYGSYFLARSGAKSVVGVDLSGEAMSEARERYRLPNLSYVQADVEKVRGAPGVPADCDVVVNFENLEHLKDPRSFLKAARHLLQGTAGVLISSTPNGEQSDRDDAGHLRNPFHVNEFTRAEFSALLGDHFSQMDLFGQWQTVDAKLRIQNAEALFEQLCDLYFDPFMRLGRFVRRILGKRVAGPPRFTAKSDSHSWDYTMAPIDGPPFEWAPTVLLAVCRV
jgi:SAM-dependent methyltransferase